MKAKFLSDNFRRLGGAIALCSSALLLTACYENPGVKLDSGAYVQGNWSEDTKFGPSEFLGIPYAKAPVGDLRFAPPQAAELSGLVEAKALGASCVQNPGALSALGELSEDCLTLNVYVPDVENYHEKFPVMVWIHGGAFLAGGSNQYDGNKLATDNNVIVVTLNYRLGALGFFSHPLVDAEQGKPTGNLGLLDQQLAMQWVKDNIDEFGGDNNNITLFGESAGSMSTCAQMVAPGSQDLANRFIMQSGVCVGNGLAIFPKQTVEYISSGLAYGLCPEAADTLACLRDVPAEQVMAYGAENGIFGQGWGPTVIEGDSVLPDFPANLIANGEFNQGGIILGTNQYEWSLFQAIDPGSNVANTAELNAFIDSRYPPAQAATLKYVYAPPADAYANVYLSALLTDQVFRCPTRTMANVASEKGVPVWLYSFEQNNPAHAYELPYLFNYVSEPFGIDPTNSPTKDVFQSYWTTYAKTGTPNNNVQPDWPSYDASAQAYMILKDSPEANIELAKGACDVWDSFAAQ